MVRVPSRTAPEPEEADRVGRWSHLGSLQAMLRSPGEAETQLWEEGKRCWSVQRSGARRCSSVTSPLMGPRKARCQAAGAI